MGKHEKGTPKEIANRSKGKGLQKLKWYCQMCHKQCRDQNGFKCHLTSESHQRQLLLFAENPDAYLSDFSKEFESRFLYILKTSFGGKRVRANDVYQDYIRDRANVHMNATRWHTLSGFVQYLEKVGKCKVDQNEKGWHIQYIDKEEEIRKKERQDKVRHEKEEEERDMEAIERQVERGKEVDTTSEHVATDLVRNEEDEKIAFSLKAAATLLDEKRDSTESKPSTSVFEDVKSRKRKSDQPETSKMSRSSQKKSALDEIREMEERTKEKRNRKDYWLHEGIVVKIVTKKLGAEFYKAKGVVISVIDDYSAKVELNSGDVIKLDQNYLETVIPAVGKEMLVVNGAYRGCRAELLRIMESKFSVSLKIKSGLMRDRIIEIPYEDASKYA